MRAAARTLRRVGAAVALALGTLTCGPSFQAVYECDVQFEHCYGLDMSSAPTEAKRGCWRNWFASYTYGQSRDRVEYAAVRVNELSTDPGRTPASASPAVGSPMPKDAFVPPPNVSDGKAEPVSALDGGAPAKAAHDIAARAPGSECADECSQRWSSCYGTCQDGTCVSCDHAYRACMPFCFADDAGSPRPMARSRR